jgi:hypothetical protein
VIMTLLSIKQIELDLDLFFIIALVLDHECEDVLWIWKEKVFMLDLEFPFLVEEI